MDGRRGAEHPAGRRLGTGSRSSRATSSASCSRRTGSCRRREWPARRDGGGAHAGTGGEHVREHQELRRLLRQRAPWRHARGRAGAPVARELGRRDEGGRDLRAGEGPARPLGPRERPPGSRPAAREGPADPARGSARAGRDAEDVRARALGGRTRACGLARREDAGGAPRPPRRRGTLRGAVDAR